MWANYADNVLQALHSEHIDLLYSAGGGDRRTEHGCQTGWQNNRESNKQYYLHDRPVHHEFSSY